MSRMLRGAFVFALTVGVAGCYQSHGPSDGTCGGRVCGDGEQCCPTCDGAGRCISLDLVCERPSCDGCFSSFDCAGDEVCVTAAGRCGGVGTCEPVPRGCDGGCPGVCGCDGVTYCNECEALAFGGVSVDRPGDCGGEVCGFEVCGPGQICCPGCFGEGFCSDEPFGCPDIFCPEGCGSSAECPPDMYCAFPPGACFDFGECVPRPDACDPDCPGVCGCDGVSYCSECEAAANGVSVERFETCEGIPCGRGGEVCDPDQYCDLGSSCGMGDDWGCVARPTGCDDVFDPVCGCDGRTYGNSCEAAASGVTVAAPGECAPCTGPDCGTRSCADILRAEPGAPSGVYTIQPEPGAPGFEVFCDMTTDGGGWTLVASTRGLTLDDARGSYHRDLTTTSPRGGHSGIWDGLRALVPSRSDVRFTCRTPRDRGMRVDLSFYDVVWYREWTTGNDAASCFSEMDGRGFDRPAPARRDNLGGRTIPLGTPWMAGYLEGEDSCEDDGDFTVDLLDRGMDSNEMDGTDWGEDDSSPKCGNGTFPEASWHVWVREL